MAALEVSDMAPRCALQHAGPQGEMIQQIIIHIYNPHHFKELPVRPQYVIVTRPQQSTLNYMGPRIQVL